MIEFERGTSNTPYLVLREMVRMQISPDRQECKMIQQREHGLPAPNCLVECVILVA